MQPGSRPVVVGALILAVVGLLPTAAPVHAQGGRPPAVEAPLPAGTGPTTILQDASETRDQLRQLLQSHPPALMRVLKLDPQLMTAESYLAAYPAVALFLRTHPEVARNPNYFLGFIDSWGNIEEPVTAEAQVRREAINMWQGTLTGILVLTVMAAILSTLIWLVRNVIAHRRWLRTAKTQSDVHGRLLERFSSNDELMAYVQSTAGQQFLTAMPMLDASTHAPSPIAAPFGRILWAVQAGLVLISGGVGLLVIRNRVVPEVADSLLTMGVLAISLGVGFAMASVASYMISRRMGLIEPKSAPHSQP